MNDTSSDDILLLKQRLAEQEALIHALQEKLSSRTEREKHACTQCDAIVQAPVPSRPIERGIAGAGLLARVLSSKYAEHTLLYRQSEYTAARVWN